MVPLLRAYTFIFWFEKYITGSWRPYLPLNNTLYVFRVGMDRKIKFEI